MLPEGARGAVGLVPAAAQQPQSVDAGAQRSVERFTVDVIHAEIEQLVGLGPARGAGQNREMREVLLHGLDDPDDLLVLLGRDHQQPGRPRARGFQQVLPRSVSVEHRKSELAQHFDPVRVELEHRRLDPVGPQQPPDDAAEPAEAGDDHFALLIHRVRFPFHDLPGSEPGLNQLLVDHHQHRGECHAHRDGGDQRRGHVIGDHPVLRGEGKQHEREFTPLRQREGEQEILIESHAEGAPQHQQDDELDRHQRRNQSENQARRARDQIEVDRGAHGDEEDGEQQSLERVDLALQLVAVLAVGQHDAGEEGSQRRAQSHLAHQQRDPDDQQQCGGREQLAQPGAGDDPEYGSQQVAAGDHDRRHGREDDESLFPRGQSLHPGRRVRRRVCAVARRIPGMVVARTVAGAPARDRADRQQRHQRQHRDHRDVLEQQHREGALSAVGADQVLLVQGLQHDRGRRQRERHAHRDRGLPREAGEDADAGEQHRADPDLESPEAEDRLAHLPEQGRTQLESDQEEHHDHAELGEVHHVLSLFPDQAEREGADHHAGDEVSEDRAETEALGDRDRDHRGGEVDEGLPEEPFCVHALPLSPAAARRDRR